MPRKTLALLTAVGVGLMACSGGNAASTGAAAGDAVGADAGKGADGMGSDVPSPDAGKGADSNVGDASPANADGSSDATTGSLPMSQFLDAMVSARCSALEKCAAEGIRLFADPASCKATLQLAQMSPSSHYATAVAAVQSGKASYDAGQAYACVQAIATSCANFKPNKDPTACMATFTGSLPDGKECDSALYCTSRRCAKPGTGCGKCAPLGKEGSACTYSSDCDDQLLCMEGECGQVLSGVADDACLGDEQCGPGLFCRPDLKVCATGGDSGSDCMTPKWCAAGLVCKTNKSAYSGHSCGYPGTANQACSSSPFGPGECQVGLVCGLKFTKYVCLPVVAIGGECTANEQCGGVDAACTAGKCALLPTKGQACEPPQPGSPATWFTCVDPWVCDPTTKVCVAPPPAGQPCIENKCDPTAKCTNQNCTSLAKVGEACDHAWDCMPNLDCAGGVCVEIKACE